jgi:dihydrofolate reductase
MATVICDITISVDGYVAGPEQTLEQPLGRGGEQLHEWMVVTRAFRQTHGMEGGEDNPDSKRLEEHLRAIGATIMGRRMFTGGTGPWKQDPNAGSWFGDEPPFHHPVFILTHHARETPRSRTGGRPTRSSPTESSRRSSRLSRRPPARA